MYIELVKRYCTHRGINYVMLTKKMHFWN